MDIIKTLEKACQERGVELVVKPNGHCQIKGPLLVNYYPKAKTMTAYVAGTKIGLTGVQPKQAVALAFTPPKLSKHEARRKHRSKNGPLFQRLWERQEGNCYVCQAPMVREQDGSGLYATWEHRVPLARGGLDHSNNLALSHHKCNSDRGHDMPELE